MGDHRLAHGARSPRAAPAAGDRRRPGSGGGRSRIARHQVGVARTRCPRARPRRGKPIENVSRPRWPCLGEQRDDQARVQPAREQDARPARRPPSAVDRDAQRLEQRVLPVLRRPVRARRVAREGGSQYTLLAAPAVGLDDQHASPAAACARRAGSSAARARPSASSGSGAAPPGRRACRRRPARSSAGQRRGDAQPAAGQSARYSGLIPSRSRASTSRPLSRSATANANIP